MKISVLMPGGCGCLENQQWLPPEDAAEGLVHDTDGIIPAKLWLKTFEKLVDVLRAWVEKGEKPGAEFFSGRCRIAWLPDEGQENWEATKQLWEYWVAVNTDDHYWWSMGNRVGVSARILVVMEHGQIIEIKPEIDIIVRIPVREYTKKPYEVIYRNLREKLVSVFQ